MFKTRFISMLVLLMTAATGAWADEQSESFTTATYGQVTYTGEHFTITGQYIDGDGLWITGCNNVRENAANTVTISSKNGENITRIEAVIGYIDKWDAVASTSGNVTGTYANGQTITISSVNATTVTLSSTQNDTGLLQFKSWTIYYGSAASTTFAVTGITLDKTEASMIVGGETLTLTATVAPANATNKTVTWTTSNASVATVANGVVTAVGAGTATITATATNGTDDTSDDKTATCTVTVTVPVSGVTLSQTEAALNISETLTLTATVAPANATNKTVTWTTSNASVATVANGVVTAVAPGTATITATATNGTADTSDDFSATCEVTVSTATYSVALKSVTEDASNWQGKAGTGDYQELPLTGLEAGTAVSVKYSGTKKVKSVKAKKKQ